MLTGRSRGPSVHTRRAASKTANQTVPRRRVAYQSATLSRRRCFAIPRRSLFESALIAAAPGQVVAVVAVVEVALTATTAAVAATIVVFVVVVTAVVVAASDEGPGPPAATSIKRIVDVG